MRIQSFDFKSRWARAGALMQSHGIDALFLMKPANLAYFTGDGRPCTLALFSRTLQCVVAVPASDLRSVRMASAATDIRSFESEEEMFHGFRSVLGDYGLREATIGLEKNFFDASLYEVFNTHILPKARVVSATPVLSRLRMLKEPGEISCLKAAAQVADEGMAAAVRAVCPGAREIDVAAEAEYVMRRAGAEGWASPTYVASGWRSAMAHGPASLKVIEAGEALARRCRCISLRWRAATRPISAGRSSWARSQRRPIARCRPTSRPRTRHSGSDARSAAHRIGIDTAMASVLEAAGFGGAFLRLVFHGIGMEHEEAPIPGGHAVIHGEERIAHVEPGMVLGIGNCGIYRERFGIRMEDTVWVAPEGSIPLTKDPKVLRR